jgi:DNA recombination protein RmuC
MIEIEIERDIGAENLTVLFIVIAVAVFAMWRTSSYSLQLAALESVLRAIEAKLERSDRTLQDEFIRSREEAASSARLSRDEARASFGTLADGLRNSMGDLGHGQKIQLDAFGATLTIAKSEASASAMALRQEVKTTLQQLGEAIGSAMTRMGSMQTEKLQSLITQLNTLTEANERRQEQLRQTVEGRLDKLRAENTEKLEQVRQTVEEKLQGTLEQRLGESFRQVSEQLERVYRSVGEMQTLASGVGDLKRVLTNIKTRGTYGEVALGNLLEQVMASEQYARNVEIRPASNQRVEYAIRLPAGSDDQTELWLPLDAKFPQEDYERLVDAADRGDLDEVEAASKAVELRIRSSARDIYEKYVCPPHSTDFAILFLPTEGLFAEIVRRPGLVEALQRECRVVVTGPTTLLAVLSSLRMGFRTLAIQKRSSEVWRVLGAVKAEFEKFGKVMDRVQVKLDEAQNIIADEVAKRRRVMGRKLREVEALPETEAVALLGTLGSGDAPSEESEAD